MRKLILFIATSLDGYIARTNGEVDWLLADEDFGYEEFYQSVDTVLLGNRTYEQVLTFGEYPYQDKTSYVFTRNTSRAQQEWVAFVSEDIIDFTRMLKEQPGGNIWLVGGANVIHPLQKAGLIDEYILFIHPTILGCGIPLFKPHTRQTELKLTSTKIYPPGLVEARYERV
ncbi:dihydrofolate reductase family protein [Nibrella saemangeumensis]|uniref:Dihydrofolate reductase family protein n=1 Tax=Nibrella saemangeumensis TaxID=1084526 RepID=A0ABP8MKS6_9BACT